MVVVDGGGGGEERMRAGENRNEGHLELLIWEFPADWLEFAAAGHGCNCLS